MFKVVLGFVKAPPPKKTLPKALRTQALTALTSNFSLVGLVQYAWQAKFDLVWQVWFGRYRLVGLAWFGRFSLLGFVWQVWFRRFRLVGLVCKICKTNSQSQTYQSKPTNPNLPTQTYQTKPAIQTCQTKSNFAYQAYLTKPTKPKLLVKAVNAWVRSTFGNV